tara:strand:+ start:880 stop:2490 length:1611 start_codon:yes stop_codon:yes gene_type:complete
MKILGIHASYNAINHDPSACLMINGKIVTAIEEERCNRIKTSIGYFPYKSISAILNSNNLKMKDIDLVVSSGLIYKPLKFKIKNSLINYFGYSPKIHIIGHPQAHIYGSYFSSGFKEALCISMDALGDKVSTLIYQATGGKFNELHRSGNSFQKESLGVFYAAFTEFLGFRRSEGEFKFMGMSAYGKKKINLDDIISLNKDFKIKLNNKLTIENNMPITSTFEPMVNVEYLKKISNKRFVHKPTIEKKFSQKHFDLAYSIQKKYEEIFLSYVKKFKGNNNNICISGGCALNCLANSYLLDLFENIYVMPAASDRGLSIGNAYAGAVKNKIRTQKLNDMFLGIKYTKKEILQSIKLTGVKYSIVNEYKSAAKDLKQKKIIAWFKGRSEFGPRALGARSILALANIKNIKKQLNAKVKFREKFRPFAPVMLYDFAKKNGIKREFPYMTIANFPNKKLKKKLGDAIHKDGSTRIQTVKDKKHPLYKLLKNLEKKNQVLINTSFNTSGEPIVESPTDAIRTFFASGIDVLYLESFRITKN